MCEGVGSVDMSDVQCTAMNIEIDVETAWKRVSITREYRDSSSLPEEKTKKLCLLEYAFTLARLCCKCAQLRNVVPPHTVIPVVPFDKWLDEECSPKDAR